MSVRLAPLMRERSALVRSRRQLAGASLLILAVLAPGCGARSDLPGAEHSNVCEGPVLASDAGIVELCGPGTCAAEVVDASGTTYRMECDGTSCTLFAGGKPVCVCDEPDGLNTCSNGVPACFARFGFPASHLQSTCPH